MAGLTALILSTLPDSPPADADLYLEQANAVPPSNGTQLDALRAICLYFELYRSNGEWLKASVGLARTASDVCVFIFRHLMSI